VGWGVGMGLFRDLDLRPVTLSVAPYTLRKYGQAAVTWLSTGRDRIDQGAIYSRMAFPATAVGRR
jgi:hypothetical protein